MPDNVPKLVYVLPRVRIVTGDAKRKVVNVGKAQFWPDEDETWNHTLRKVRPRWLDVFRDFPIVYSLQQEQVAESEPSVARGTLLISDDDDWLKRYVENLIPIAYVLGLLQNHRLSIPPAEAFQYGGFLATDRQEEQVTLVTKFGDKIETTSSLKLFPPLELRGVQREYLIEIGDEAYLEAMRDVMQVFHCPPSAKLLNRELVRRFDEIPDDRIVMACYHLFRSQFGNDFASPLRQDYSAYCASLEAALDVDGTQRGIGVEIANRLVNIYPDLPEQELRLWFKGLYVERSVFVHGAATRTNDEDEQAKLAFHRCKHNSEMLRWLCVDAIHDSLRMSLGHRASKLARLEGEPYSWLCKIFDSDRKWIDLAHHFTQSQSVERVLGYSGAEIDHFVQDCRSFVDRHDWRCMATEKMPNTEQVFKVLAAVAYTICKSDVASSDDKTAASKIVDVAEKKDRCLLRQCVWKRPYAGDELVPLLKSVAFHTAAFFTDC